MLNLECILKFKDYRRFTSDYDTMVFNHSARLTSDKASNFIFKGDSLTVVSEGKSYNFRLDETTKKSKNSEIRGRILNINSENYFALNVDRIYNLRFILKDEEVKNRERKYFIEDLISTQEELGCLIIFNKKDITLKIDIDKFKMIMPGQELYYSKVDVKINDKIKPEGIICMLNHIPDHLTIRLEVDSIDEIIEPMKSKILIERLKEQGIKFLYKGIEIEPRIIKSEQDEDDLKNELKEIETKRERLNMDCDK